MRRIDSPEILDSPDCPPAEVETSLRDLCRINRWFGGVSTTRWLLERVARERRLNRLSMLNVASGIGEVPRLAARKLARKGIAVEVTSSDVKLSHLIEQPNSVVADGLALPFAEGSFDVVGCNLFAHHLAPDALACFVREGLRVSRHALLINDLVRDRRHLMLVYLGFALMRSHVSRVDGVASVKRAYVPKEIREIALGAFPTECQPRAEVSRHYLFRMGVIVWKG